MPSYKKRLRWFLLLMGAGVFYWYIWVWNPLPSDEEMIEHFQTHRADFEEAVRRYREYPVEEGKDSSLWFKEGDTLEVFERAGIYDIDEAYSIIWLPNPYTVETAIRAEELAREKRALGLGPAWLRGYTALSIRPTKIPRTEQSTYERDGFSRVSLVWGSYWKNYMYFPEPPRVENGQLIWAYQTVGKGLVGSQFHEKEGVATSTIKKRVEPSLNYMPSKWKRGECIYRQIEARWFLAMCNG